MMTPTRTVLFARRSLLAQARPLSRGFATSMRLREYLFYLGDAVVVGNNPASPGLVITMSGNPPWLTFMHPENAQKIVVSQPVVELDGDEMTRIIWKKIREEVRSSDSLVLSTFLKSIYTSFI